MDTFRVSIVSANCFAISGGRFRWVNASSTLSKRGGAYDFTGDQHGMGLVTFKAVRGCLYRVLPVCVLAIGSDSHTRLVHTTPDNRMNLAH